MKVAGRFDSGLWCLSVLGLFSASPRLRPNLRSVMRKEIGGRREAGACAVPLSPLKVELLGREGLVCFGSEVGRK